MGQASISHIKNSLDRVFGKGQWNDLETETISLTLGIWLDELTRDKIHVLQILERKPELFFEDPMVMLYATDVINNIEADFEHVPVPTTLELAYAIEEVKKMLSAEGEYVVFGPTITNTIAYMLKQDGYSEPLEPFDFVPKEMLEPGQTAEDTENKRKAIKKYLKEMGA
ncbi:hypothetical protein D3C86_1687890 [compost metagenome]